ncbi:MAG: hypothetical protein J3K34DRAFT_439423 [Monoraphidium minutum]|nr:MAG: hypothetical protein J3K34DRAFT_439423 [Monoraphidium minutum]
MRQAGDACQGPRGGTLPARLLLGCFLLRGGLLCHPSLPPHHLWPSGGHLLGSRLRESGQASRMGQVETGRDRLSSLAPRSRRCTQAPAPPRRGLQGCARLGFRL